MTASAPEPPQDPDRHDRTDDELARHIADECDRLRRVARGPRLKTINYMLGLAKTEAEKLTVASRKQ